MATRNLKHRGSEVGLHLKTLKTQIPKSDLGKVLQKSMIFRARLCLHNKTLTLVTSDKSFCLFTACHAAYIKNNGSEVISKG